ncbi:hypothetical protein BHE74_00046452 [Ensete ventricosum]|nr:hypothetical protein BHE74_00046452 [Ensete ventricosum]
MGILLSTKDCNTDGYRLVAGGTVDWGCFHLVTTRNRAVTIVGRYQAITIDFDHHRSLSGGNGRSRPSPTDFGGRKKKSEKKREKKGENLESDTVLSSLNPDPSPSLRGISSRGLLGEKTFLLPAWGKGTRTSHQQHRYGLTNLAINFTLSILASSLVSVKLTGQLVH